MPAACCDPHASPCSNTDQERRRLHSVRGRRAAAHRLLRVFKAGDVVEAQVDVDPGAQLGQQPNGIRQVLRQASPLLLRQAGARDAAAALQACSVGVKQALSHHRNQPILVKRERRGERWADVHLWTGRECRCKADGSKAGGPAHCGHSPCTNQQARHPQSARTCDTSPTPTGSCSWLRSSSTLAMASKGQGPFTSCEGGTVNKRCSSWPFPLIAGPCSRFAPSSRLT